MRPEALDKRDIRRCDPAPWFLPKTSGTKRLVPPSAKRFDPILRGFPREDLSARGHLRRVWCRGSLWLASCGANGRVAGHASGETSEEDFRIAPDRRRLR